MSKKKKNLIPKRKSARVKDQQQKKSRYLWLAIGGLAVVLLVVGLFYLGYNGQAIANSGIEGVEIFADPGRAHVNGDVEYTSLTPAGGPHNPVWVHCGIYDEPVRQENVIHTMEHGAVWLAYQEDLPADQVEYLRDIVRQERAGRGEGLIVLAPQPGLEDTLVATAWRVQLKLDDVFDDRLQAFLDRYQRGPFYPEPGASCMFGGIGEPIM